jgi:hypothetical protein
MTSPTTGIAEARRRAVMLELNELIIETIDSRLWARQGINLALAQQEREAADEERISRIRASAQRALDYWNSMTLITIHGGIEDLIESMGSGLYPIVLDANPDTRTRMFEHNRLRNRKLREGGELSNQGAQALTHLTKRLADELLKPPLKAPSKEMPTADSWEDLLERIKLRSIPGRPLPEDLRQTLNEFGAVRNVILHRMGRIDERALKQIAVGPWRTVDELVVIDNDLYRIYIAALVAYQAEINDRIRNLMKLPVLVDISQWRSMVPAGG